MIVQRWEDHFNLQVEEFDEFENRAID